MRSSASLTGAATSSGENLQQGSGRLPACVFVRQILFPAGDDTDVASDILHAFTVCMYSIKSPKDYPARFVNYLKGNIFGVCYSINSYKVC